MKVLIVEDNKEIGKMLERVFRISGFETSLAEDGELALNYLRKSEKLPDAIILDIIIPKISGIDLLRIIKEETNLKNIPVMVLTNSFLEENAAQFLALGADMYLIKMDHDPVDIVDKITKLIESKKNIK
jgi:DNA-binding response OmpR family regulator